MERGGIVKTVITENIDNLHQRAGNENVYEFHGNSRNLVCIKCGSVCGANEKIFDEDLPPLCNRCGRQLSLILCFSERFKF